MRMLPFMRQELPFSSSRATNPVPDRELPPAKRDQSAGLTCVSSRCAAPLAVHGRQNRYRVQGGACRESTVTTELPPGSDFPQPLFRRRRDKETPAHEKHH